MKYFSHLNTAATVIKTYDGSMPFNIFIRDFFRQHKKYGSKDRKNISHLCYCCFRTGHALQTLKIEERILAALFLCSAGSNELLAHLSPHWNAKAHYGITDKWKEISLQYSVDINFSGLFPAPATAFSPDLETEKFLHSHLQQPDFFIRIRPGHKDDTLHKLKQAGIAYTFMPPATVRLPNGSKIEPVLEADKEIVIQDYNSQRTGIFMEDAAAEINSSPLRIWDCCTGSGGKSLLAYDSIRGAELTVSDVRDSILINLRKRFEKAGIRNYQSFVWDLERATAKIKPVELIIADVPCTGSGTWGRNPEHLVYFRPSEIERYSGLQKKIVTNAIPLLSKNGFFLYITCSVFRAENEDIVSHIQDSCGLTLLRQELLKGYDLRADSMFAALFRN
jgi:16S rRNA (cytosine967-C5)-methyltransferase